MRSSHVPPVGYLDAACRDRERTNVVHLDAVLRARRLRDDAIATPAARPATRGDQSGERAVAGAGDGPAWTPDGEPHAIPLPWREAWRPVPMWIVNWGCILFVSLVVGYVIGSAL